ncbi:hypothetical protein GQ43DRAFT_477494 [Delitschia confertaspora ATCC 74209]|uniref:Uncharacterized protein n=1 Tax=Delitschia confertaspora ATCC 74209 TaxID=1513339 RepID=A0A9P4JUA8_9PLEO|nr:hypothetical protein GQ43DRAFT_477494 [Delitschia confertaspora ATCC 74209]
MIKRKFSFGLAPVKVPSKSEPRSKITPDPSPAQPRHQRQQSGDSVYISHVNTPWMSRQQLDYKTERELKAACALILQEFNPSGHVFEEASRPKPDLERPTQQSKGGSNRYYRAVAVAERPRSSHEPTKQSVNPNHDMKDVFYEAPVQVSLSRRRNEQELVSADKELDLNRNNPKPPVVEPHARSTTLRTETDSDDATSLKTPLTSSTEAHCNNASTAPTSAAYTSCRSSKRESHQFENATVFADSAARVQRELGSGRQQPAQSGPNVASGSQAPSRSRSIRAEIKEYIFPGSTTLSHAPSSEHMRDPRPTLDLKRKDSTTSHGWRSWGLQRKSSSRGSSRPTTSKGRIESRERELEDAGEVNLNRELPPLPSLDQWRSQCEKNEESRKSAQGQAQAQAQGAHIATVMRGQDQDQADFAATIKQQHRRSGSEPFVFPQPSNSLSQADQHQHHKPPRTTSTKRTQSRETPSMDFDQLLSVMDAPANLPNQLELCINNPYSHSHSHGRNHSMGTELRSPKGKISIEQSRMGAPNFSRKISAEVVRSTRNAERMKYSYPNAVNIEGKSSEKRKEKGGKSGLKRMFSNWTMKKERKGANWMDQLEQSGVQKGILVQDEAAAAPVVRY